MNDNSYFFQELLARKEQILNLEIRLFVIIFVIEILFILFYFKWVKSLQKKRVFVLLSFSVIFVLFFEMVAINGKMGLISMYLRQIETHLTSLGYKGLVWESIALDKIIFVPGNAFTLPAGLAILTILCQSFYSIHFTCSSFITSKFKSNIITVVLCFLILLLVIKSLTVDFHAKLPNIFM